MFIKSSNQLFIIAVCVFSLVSCNSGTIAPVVELHPQYSMNKSQTTYVVRPGDTLYAIAFLYDINYEQLAQANQISYPYHLKSGQIIRLIPLIMQVQWQLLVYYINLIRENILPTL